jgi:hypothetical protein
LIRCTAGDVHLPRALGVQERSISPISSRSRLGLHLEVAGEAAQEVEVAPHLVVEDGDVPRGLVRDDDVVPVLVQLVEDAAHGDHVVVRVREKTTIRFPAGSLLRPRILEISALNTSPFSGPGGPVARQQRAQVVLAVVDASSFRTDFPVTSG